MEPLSDYEAGYIEIVSKEIEYEGGSAEYINCESKGESLYILPDSVNTQRMYLTASRKNPQQNGEESPDYSNISERPSVRSFISEFEKKLSVPSGEPSQTLQNSDKTEIYYMNSQPVLSERKTSWNNRPISQPNEAEFAACRNTGAQNQRLLKIQHEDVYEQPMASSNPSPKLVLASTSCDSSTLYQNYGPVSKGKGTMPQKQGNQESDNEEGYEQPRVSLDPYRKFTSKVDKSKRRGTAGRLASLRRPKFFKRSKIRKLNKENDEEQIALQENEGRSWGGGDIAMDDGYIEARIATDVASILRAYLQEMSAGTRQPLNENDIKSILGVSAILKRRQTEIRQQCGEYEEITRRPEFYKKRPSYETEASPPCVASKSQENHCTGEFEDQLYEVMGELESLGKHRSLRSGKEGDLEANIRAKGSGNSGVKCKVKTMFIVLFFMIILISWAVFIYIAIDRKHIRTS